MSLRSRLTIVGLVLWPLSLVLVPGLPFMAFVLPVSFVRQWVILDTDALCYMLMLWAYFAVAIGLVNRNR